MSHCISATIMHIDDVPQEQERLFRKTNHPEFYIASTVELVRAGWDNSASKHADISTDYFGGSGTQYASYSEADGSVKHFSDSTKGGAVNTALALLKVPKEEGKDLFDVLGLSRYRCEEDLTPYIPDPNDQ